ncbi:MAG: efflux RND transporter periplasmic adaptor subunit [Syntrophobacter sp.]
MGKKQRPPGLKLFALILFFACFFAACGKGDAPGTAPRVPNVTVSRPVEQEVTDYAEFTATTEAFESVKIQARVEGYLEKILFKDGARVAKGDLLFVIERKPYQIRLEQAKANLMQSQAELKLAETALHRKEGALKNNAISEIEVIEARTRCDTIRAAVAAAQAGVETAQLNLSYTEVRTPIGGKINRPLVDVGNLVGAGDKTLLATVVNDEPIYAYFNVSERDLLMYQQRFGKSLSPLNGSGKTKILLSLQKNMERPYEGFLDYVDNRIDAGTGTIQTRGIFPNADHALLPGLFGRVRLPLGSPRKALLVPEQALGADQRGRFLLVVNERSEVDYRSVQVGQEAGDFRVIEKGLGPGDQVIVNGVQQARPGIKVNPTLVEMRPDATLKTAAGTSVIYSADGGRSK